MGADAVPEFDIGDDIVIHIEFRDRQDVPANPDAVELKVLRPDGSTVAVTTTNPASGMFEGIYNIAAAGDHWARGTGTGNVNETVEGMFIGRERRVP